MRGFAFACAAVVAVALPSASVVRAQSLGLTMSVSRPQTVLAGGTFSETVTVTNPGTSATGTVNVELAGGGNEQWCETSPASGCAGLTGGAAIFPIGSIASGASATAQFDVKTTADLGNGMADGTVRAGDGNVFALTDSHWVLKLDPNAQPTDVTAQFVSNSTPFDPQYNGETVWRVTNRGDGPARGIVFEFHITPSPYELYDHGDIFGGTPTLLPYLQPGASDTVVVDTYTTGATTESAMVSHNEPDTDSSNNGASTSFTPATGGSGGGGGGGGGGGQQTPPPYAFADHAPPATEDRFFSFESVSCPGGGFSCVPGATPTVVVIAGSLPSGVRLINSEGTLSGTPYIPGRYTFTLQATLPEQNYLPIEKQYTVVVDPLRNPSSGSVMPVLPQRSLTPGVANPAVTQATNRSTICATGWTKTIRPPLSYLSALKVRQMKQYGETGSTSLYEEDQLIPLELGGAPRDPKNLWPEPRTQATGSNPLESALAQRVCRGTLSLTEARIRILTFKRTHG